MISSYNHNGMIGVLVELECSNLSWSKNQLKSLADDLAMHIAALDPSNVKELLSQGFVKNPDQTVTELLNATSLEIGSSVSIIRYIRWEQRTGDDQSGPDDEPAAASMLRQA